MAQSKMGMYEKQKQAIISERKRYLCQCQCHIQFFLCNEYKTLVMADMNLLVKIDNIYKIIHMFTY